MNLILLKICRNIIIIIKFINTSIYFVVIVKIHDCRIYHASGSDHIIREYSEKTSSWKRLFEELNLEMSQVTTPEQVEPHLHTEFTETDIIHLSS